MTSHLAWSGSRRVLSALLVYSTCMSGPVVAGDLLLEETFGTTTDGALPAHWQALTGEWRVEGGKLHARPAPEGESILLLGDATWQDVTMEIELAPQASDRKAGAFGLIIREGDKEKPGPRFLARWQAGRPSIFELSVPKPAPDKGTRLWQTARLASGIPTNKPIRLRIEAGGTWLRAFVDDQRVLQSPRGDEASPSGRVGLVVSGAPVRIERVKVTRFEAPTDKPNPPAKSVPLIIAHRGFSWIAPENTLASYRLAMKTCADMAECDTYLTSDGVPILLHDGTFQRTAGVRKKPAELTLAEVRKLEAGSWKASEYKGEGVPTLQELLELTKGHLRLVIEIKQEKIEAPVLKAIQASGTAPEDVMIFSFHRSAVDAIARLEPLLPTTWLVGDLPFDEAGRKQVIRDAMSSRVSALGLPQERVDPEFVRLAHACGLSVFVWTVDEPDDMRFLIKTGVDGIITDRPDVACEILGRTAPAGNRVQK